MSRVEVFQGDAAELEKFVPDGSVACVVTSPPYNTGMPYDGVDDGISLAVYRKQVSVWSKSIAASLMPGGRLWLNVPPTLPVIYEGDRGATRWSPLQIWQNALTKSYLSLEYRDTVVWHQDVPDQATAWGSWMSPNAPNLRGRWEAVLVFSKGPWRRFDEATGHVLYDDGVTETDFATWTRNVWTIPPARRTAAHPCPFPDELVRRAVLLSTVAGETVLDPFLGSGTTVRVAAALGRDAIGIDLSPAYIGAFTDRGVQAVLR